MLRTFDKGHAPRGWCGSWVRVMAAGALLGSGALQLGCGALFGSSFVVPPELAQDAHRYSLLVDYQSFSTEKPRRRAEFTPVAGAETGRAGTCRFAFQVAGELEELPSGPASEEGELLVWRYPSRFVYHLDAPPGPRVEVQGTGERTVVELVGDGPTEGRVPVLGDVTVDPERVRSRAGQAQLLFNGALMGAVKRENTTLRVHWGEEQYLTESLSETERSVRRGETMVFYAKLDAGHWGVGERAFHVAADPSLECEPLQRVVSVLLLAQLFTGE